MKLFSWCAVVVVMLSLATWSRSGDETGRFYEYATIRWGGRENTHIIRPGGKVEFIGTELRKVTKPERVDDRSFYMNIVMNGLSKEGWEFAGMTPDDIVMKRSVK